MLLSFFRQLLRFIGACVTTDSNTTCTLCVLSHLPFVEGGNVLIHSFMVLFSIRSMLKSPVALATGETHL